MGKKLEELEVGDEVVVCVYSDAPLKLIKVEKVTKTQLTTADGIRFNRRDGIKIGEGYTNDKWSSYIRTHIVYIFNTGVMSWQEAEIRNSELAARKEIDALARRIKDIPIGELTKLSAEVLRGVLFELGLDEVKP
jgi:hypothetical protein